MGIRPATALLWLVLGLSSNAAFAANCSWIGGDGDWNDPARWNNCAGGNGTPADTPGPADNAAINAPGSTITLINPVNVNSLNFGAGTISGTAPLQVNTLIWSGGTMAGDPLQMQPSSLLISNGTLTGSLQSNDRYLRLFGGGTVTLQDGADLSITQNTPPAEPCGPLPFTSLCITAGSTLAVSSSLANPSQLSANIGNFGRLEIAAAPATAEIQSGFVYQQSFGAQLNLLGGTLQQLGAGETLGFAGGRITGFGTLGSDSEVEFFAATVDIGGVGVETLNVNATALFVRPAARLIFDIQDDSTFDRVISTAPVVMEGYLQVRSPLASSGVNFNLMTGTLMSVDPSAYETALFTHVANAVGNMLQLTLAGGQNCIWTGPGTDFQTAGNWTNCGGVVPSSGDTAIIDLANAIVNVPNTTAVSRLKLAAQNGILTMAPGVELNVTDYFKWSAGTVVSSAGGSLHLNFGSLGMISNPGNTQTRSLDGTLTNGAKLAFGDNFGFNLQAGSIINNGQDLVFGNGALSVNNVLSGGIITNNAGVITVLEGAELPATIELQQSSGGQTIIRGGNATFNMSGTHSGLLQVDAGSLTLDGGATTLDSASVVMINGQLILLEPLLAQGSFSVKTVIADGQGANSGALTLDTLSAPMIERLELSGGSVAGTAAISLAELILNEAQVNGDISGAETLNVSRLLRVIGTSATSVLNNRSTSVTPGAELLIDNNNTLDVTGNGGLSINGTLRISQQLGGEIATLTGTAPIIINRQVFIGDNRTLEFGGNFAPNLGGPSDEFVIQGSGVLQRIGQPLVLDNTVVRGNGTVRADVQADATIFEPSSFSVPTGILTIDGDATFGSAAEIRLDVDGLAPGSGHDQLIITGTADLQDPLIRAAQPGTFDPGPADVFELISFSTGSAGSVFNTDLAVDFLDTHELASNAPFPSATAIQLRPLAPAGPLDCTWIASTFEDWDTATNWDCGGGAPGVPGTGDTARIMTASADVDASDLTDREIGTLIFEQGRLFTADSILVEDLLQWTQGTFAGVDTNSRLFVLPSASGELLEDGGSRTIDNSGFVNNGSLLWSGNNITLNNAALFVSDGTLTVDVAAVLSMTETGTPGSLFGNLGSLIKNGVGELRTTNVLYGGTGALTINAGSLRFGLHPDVDFLGAEINNPGTLAFADPTPFTYPSSVAFTGTGLVLVDNGASLTFESTFDSTLGVFLQGAATVTMDTASPLNLRIVQVGPGSILQGSADLVLADLGWSGGEIRGAPGSFAHVTPGSSGSQLNGPDPKVLDGRELRIESMIWDEGAVDVRNGAFVDVPGTFSLSGVSLPGTRTLQCSAGCASPVVNISGVLVSGGGPGVDYVLDGTVSVSNQSTGVIRIDNNRLDIDGTFSNDGTVRLGQNDNNATLRRTTPLAFTLGGTAILDGRGTIDASIDAISGSVITPSHPGTSNFGVLNITGDLDHSTGGVLRIEADGTSPGDFDQIVVTGTVTPGFVEALGSLPAGNSVPFILHATRVAPYATLVGAQSADFAFDNSNGASTSLTRLGPPNLVVDRDDDPTLPGPGDACTAAPNDCSLRGAILLANALPGPTGIDFNIPGTPGAVYSIALTSALPALSQSILINGYTQNGATTNTSPVGPIDAQLKIELDGTAAGPGPLINITAADTLITGISLINCDIGIRSSAAGNGAGIQGNFIGMAADGLTALGCNIGVQLLGEFAVVGGPMPEQRNLIAANSVDQVQMSGTALEALIEGNLIGVNRTGGVVVNAGVGNGVLLNTSCVSLPTPGVIIRDNVIGGRSKGILIAEPFGTTGAASCAEPANVDILGNLIGIGAATESIPNVVGVDWNDQGSVPVLASVRLGDGGDPLAANVIANNTAGGVRVSDTAVGLRVNRNEIFANIGLGVDLLANASPTEINLPTPNDDDDTDTGGNALQNFPLISSVAQTTTVDIVYSVDSLPTSSDYDLDVDFYINDNGQAGLWLGRDTYTEIDHGGLSTPGSKSVSFAGTIAADDEIIAIASDFSDNSSEFSFAGTMLALDPIADSPIGVPRNVSGTISTSDGEPFQIDGQIDIDDGTDTCGPLSLIPTVTPGSFTFSCILPTTGVAGSRSAVATFVPLDAYYQPATDSTLSNVVSGATATSAAVINISPSPVSVGAVYDLTAEVSALSGATAPTGTVAIAADAPFAMEGCVASLTPISATIASGTCQLNSAVSGVRQFRANYAGDVGFDPAPASAAVPQVVRTTSLFPPGGIMQSATQTRVGEPFDVTVTVRGGDAVPTGMVTVQPQPFGVAQNCMLTPVPLSPTDAVCTVSVVAPVALGKVLRVIYAGSADSVFPPASGFEFHDTLRALTTTSITAHTPEPSQIDEPVNVQFQVSAAVGAVSSFAPLEGNVTVSDGLDSCTAQLTPVSTGTSATGSCALPLRVAGTRQLVATYETSSNFESSVSPAVPHIVAGAGGGTDLSVRIRNGLSVLDAGSSVTYTIEVDNLGGAGTGSARVLNAAPAQLSSVTWTCVPTLPSQCPSSGSGDIDRLVDLVGGGRVTFRMTGTVGSTEEAIVSTVTVTPPAGVVDSNPANNTATDRDFIGLFGDGFEAAGGE